MKRCGWLVIALIVLQSVVAGALTTCRVAPIDHGLVAALAGDSGA